ncbi:multidrug efflux system [Sterolibacterium denitrificans]|uniref:Multidrug efflux system n=2 Tax=Sterolibacterium denitrificans TaxID=157592 RepID=A0A7Z7HQT0_9PROT|nr:multidrug efflux system [Sterolibacterium denitrificans]
MIAFTLLCLLLALGYALYWGMVARHKVYTDNAYVQGNVVQVTPLAGGTVVAVNVNDTDQVQAGQVLASLDPLDSRLALDQAEARLAQTVRDTRALYATDKALAALVSARQADVRRSEFERSRLKTDLARRAGLLDAGAVSLEEVQHLRTAVANANALHAAALAALNEAQEQLAKNQTQTAGVEVSRHPRVLAAAASYREAWLAHQRREIVAPVAGTVAQRHVQVGQRVNSGVPIMAIVPLDQVWVDANFKESQLEKLRIGQAVELTADVYGSRRKFHGHVAGLAAGTGAVFSLLPAQNATGNWIKIVQRVPVRIRLDASELIETPLRVGLSMEASIDVRDQSGHAVTDASAGQAASVSATSVYADLERAADARVEAIIAGNLGQAAP